jgi:hypothetical protein
MKEELTIIASDAHWRGSPPPHQQRGTGCCCSPCFWDLRWLEKEGLRLAKI